jgi:hypothetical protein
VNSPRERNQGYDDADNQNVAFGGMRHRDASPLMRLVLPQHADQHRPQRPILLTVDQELGERAASW